MSHAVTWSFCAGKTYVTLVAKATLELDRGPDAVLVSPEPVATRDTFVQGHPQSSVMRANEAAPYLTNAAILLGGMAHSSSGATRDPFPVRLVLAARTPLVDKTLHVLDAEGRGVALTYERALRTADNPFGTDRPVVTHPKRPHEAAGFGALGPESRLRTQFLRGTSPPVFSDKLDLGREFDSRYWNPAPLDQQAPFLRGDETLLLEGFGGSRHRVEARLPRIGVTLRAEMSPGRAQPVAMSADMLVIDVTRLRVGLVFRAILAVPAEVRALRLSGALSGDPAAITPREPRLPTRTGDVVLADAKPLPFQVPTAASPQATPQPHAMQQPAMQHQAPLPPQAPLQQPPLHQHPLQQGPQTAPVRLDELGIGHDKRNPTMPFQVPEAPGPRSAVPHIPATPFDPAYQPRTAAPATGDVTAPPWSQNERMREAVKAASKAEAAPAPPPPVVGAFALGVPPAVVAPPAAVVAPPVAAPPAAVAPPAMVTPPAVVAPPPVGSVPLADTSESWSAPLAPPSRPATPAASKPDEIASRDPGRALVLARIAEGAALLDVDLTGADLHDLDLAGRTLSGSKLDGANLEGTNLNGAKLMRASLVGAVLEGASFLDADLEAAILTRAKIGRATFERANLTDADFSAATGDGAKLTGARAKRARFGAAHLTKAIFDGADLEEADFAKASVKNGSFAKAKLDRANLVQLDAEKSSFRGASLRASIFSRASLIEAAFDEADGTGSVFDSACAVKTSFNGATLDQATFEKASLDEARFDGASLSGANMAQCAGPDARFVGAKLDGAVFRQAKLEGSAFSKATLVGASFARADLTRALFDGANLTEVDARAARLGHARFDGAELDNADLRDADLTNATLTGANKATAKMKGAKLKNVVE